MTTADKEKYLALIEERLKNKGGLYYHEMVPVITILRGERDAALKQLVSVNERMEEALGIVRAVFDAGADDPALGVAIKKFIEGERRRALPDEIGK